MSTTAGTLIVTGGGRGIGAATSRLAAQQGNAIAVNFAENEAAASGVVEEIKHANGRAIAVQADVSKERDVARLFENCGTNLGAGDGTCEQCRNYWRVLET